MKIEVKTVENKRDLRRYVHFPLTLYKNHPCYVPPILADEMAVLDRKKNPSFETGQAVSWLALADGRVAGRITGLYIPRYREIWGRDVARFGWVDFIDDAAVSSALFLRAEEWAREIGAQGISGPQGFTDLDPEGMLIEGFDELGTLPMIYNYPYYPEHMARLGYQKDADWLEYEIRTPPEIPEKMQRVQRLVLKRKNLRIVQARRSKDLLPYAKGLFEVFCASYEHLYGFVPLTERQVEGYIRQYISYVDPRFTKVVVDEEEKVAAFGIAMPSFSRALQKCRGRLFPLGWARMLRAMKHPTGLDLYIIAVRPDLQNSGILAVLMSAVIQEAIEAGIQTSESSGELEDNHAVQSLWRRFEYRQHKRRRCFVKMFQSP